MKAETSRRGFLKQAAGAAIAVGMPTIVPASALGRGGRMAPSERITIGQIGCGGNGSGHVQQFMGMDGAQVLAVCDVDRTRREKSRNVVDAHYAGQTKGGSYTACGAYSDFRELLARRDLDAVCISTPDHWHAIPTIEAAKAGKDIYCEKPLSLTVHEGRMMCDAVRRHGRVFQTGSQDRSIDSNRLGCELVRNGYLGEIKLLHASLGGNPYNFPPEEMPIPDGFDYDFWLGQAPWAPYHERRCFGTFRWILDYSGGDLTDHGAHYIDLAQWGNGTEYSGPVEIEGWGDFPRDGLYNAPTRVGVECTYANGVKFTIGEGPHGAQFYGTEGSLSVGDEGMYNPDPPSLRHVKIKPNETRLTASDDHHQNFLDCIRTRREPVAPIEQAHRTVTIAHIGGIAIRLGRKLRWSPESERFIDDSEADRMLSRPMRAPWKL